MKVQVLEEAIERAQRAVEAIPEGHPVRAGYLNNLGVYLRIRYERTGNLHNLEAAITQSKAAVHATPQDHPDRATRLNNLENHLNRQDEQVGHLLDVNIAQIESALYRAPQNHPERAEWLSILGIQLYTRYKRTGNLQDLEAAIAQSAAAVQATPEYHHERAGRLSNLGMHLGERYERNGNIQDLEAAISRTEAALQATPNDHPYRAIQLNNLGLHFNRRYNRTGNLQDLEAAIARTEAAVQATPADHPQRAEWLNNLGAHLSQRYERKGDLRDLDTAIAQSTAAVQAMPEGHPERAGRLTNLGNILKCRYTRTGNLQDLETAIARSEAALQATPADHPNRGVMLMNLGSKLGSRYERTGNMQDLEAAIARSEAAVQATPADHPDRALQLSNLGLLLGNRYERKGDLQDLDTGISQSEAAVQLVPEGHPGRARWWTNLGNHLNRRYERTGDLQDLEAAIARSEAALQATPTDHPDRALPLVHLGTSLHMRYQRTGNLQDLEAAIGQLEVAVQGTPVDDPKRAQWLNNLGLHLSSRYQRTGNRQDLEAAIAKSEAAVQAIPEDHPARAMLLYNLGAASIRLYERTENRQDLEAALAAYFTSWSIITAPILIRLQSASMAASLLVFGPLEDLSRACLLLRDAVHLLPLVTSRSLEREDQQHILGKLTGLASLAASVSLEVGESPLEALRLQELGRGVTNGQLLDYRSDISDLMEHCPTLAHDFDSLRQELDSPIPSQDSSDMSLDQRLWSQQGVIRRRNKVAQDLDNILMQIRQNPGFENFLRAESEAYLLSAAREGPIVVLNVTELRSDAILVTKAEVKSISLPDLSHASMSNYCGISIGNNEDMRELLEWLWMGAVQPVLRELGFYPRPKGVGGQPQVEPLPRIWWIGVGLMAKAPIHAATKFRKGRVHTTTLQYCVPSYTSTIRALQYSRSRRLQPQQNLSMLLVTMPTTPGAGSLSGVAKEADGIKHNFSTVETLERPSAAHVLQLLPGFSIAHFACHGVSDINPADSHLLLLKESILHDVRTEEVDKLRVKDIAALKLPAARLAYLSACSTAESTSSSLLDEVTHVVSSFHIAGFTHVIGTLWSSDDQACHKMGVEFYSALSKTDNVAVSYRTAIMGLMKEKPAQPMYWAPFIHFGA